MHNNNHEEEDQQQLLNYYDDQQLDNLSLRDLPVAVVDPPPPQQNATTASVVAAENHSRRSSASSSSDPTSDFFFEFLINNDDDLVTSTADDVIFCGRLLPYAPPPTRRSLSLSSAAARLTRPQLTESPSETLPSSIRPSRSLNYRKLRRNRSNAKPKTEVFNRSLWSNKNNNSRNNNSDKSPVKLPWYSALVFGLPKVPAEMELRDIKNRQFRRNSIPSVSSTSSRLISGDRNCSSASWKLLNVLSCKSHVTVDVSNTAPFRNSLF
ncbi:hypothetical protein SOVF_182600 [Spinacia oleracea]|nr:hypothetical protein SOVF_182600 [Spinacia oleracea]